MAWYNNSSNSTIIECVAEPSYHDHYVAKAALGLLYGLVFLTAVCGNTLVIYVVATNKSMQSVTNIFITNLAVSDIVVNFTSLWLTPVYSYLGRWVWGSVMCHLVPLFQGMSTFISALTLMAIAIDRYVAILYPFRKRTSLSVCCVIVINIWIVGLLLVMPVVVQMNLYYDHECQLLICREEWIGFPEMRVVYGFVVLSLQFGVPFIVIAYCYLRIWIHLMFRRSMVVSNARSVTEERRRRHLLKMLVAMVVIYLLAWLPVNSLNVLRDATEIANTDYFIILFLFAHMSSMSASCWNPIVYAWMNENFRREFKAVLPCFRHNQRIKSRSYSVVTATGRKSLTTAMVNSASGYMNTGGGAGARPSVAISIDSDTPRKRSNHFIQSDANSLLDEDACALDENPKSPFQNSPLLRDQRVFVSKSNVNSSSITTLAMIGTPKSKVQHKLMTRKLTGKRGKHKKSDDTSSLKLPSPRRLALSRAKTMTASSNGSGDLVFRIQDQEIRKGDSNTELIMSVQTTL